MDRPAPTLVQAVDAERWRIAAELHDRSGPNLATVAMNLTLIERRLGGLLEPELRAVLAETRRLLGETIAQMRDLSGDLRPARLAYAGLLDALAERIEHFRVRTGLDVQWSANWGVGAPSDLPGNRGGAPGRLDADQEWILFRAVQEALNNCEKHAQAGRVVIELLEQDGAVALRIGDDGIGFDPQRVAQDGKQPGMGLLMMRERVEDAHGRFEIHSAPGEGTEIRITLPT